MQHRLFSILLLSSALVTYCGGCDFISGVSRTVVVRQFPPSEKIELALSEVPEITRVEHRSDHSSHHLEQFSYFTDGTLAGVVATQESAGEKYLRLYYFTMGTPPLKKTFVDHVRTLMDKVYSSLQKQVPDLPPKSEIREYTCRIGK